MSRRPTLSLKSKVPDIFKKQYAPGSIEYDLEKCTGDSIGAPDWGLNIGCCDRIGAIKSSKELEEVVSFLSSRVQSKHLLTVSLTFTLVEALVKNCPTVSLLIVVCDE